MIRPEAAAAPTFQLLAGDFLALVQHTVADVLPVHTH
jgi:hypothetical protein